MVKNNKKSSFLILILIHLVSYQHGSQTQFQSCNLSEQLHHRWIQARHESIILINAERQDQIELYKWTLIHSCLYPPWTVLTGALLLLQAQMWHRCPLICCEKQNTLSVSPQRTHRWLCVCQTQLKIQQHIRLDLQLITEQLDQSQVVFLCLRNTQKPKMI